MTSYCESNISLVDAVTTLDFAILVASFPEESVALKCTAPQ